MLEESDYHLDLESGGGKKKSFCSLCIDQPLLDVNQKYCTAVNSKSKTHGPWDILSFNAHRSLLDMSNCCSGGLYTSAQRFVPRLVAWRLGVNPAQAHAHAAERKGKKRIFLASADGWSR